MSSFLEDGLLIANPALSEMPKFESIAGRAIYIVQHSSDGAVGVSMNKNYSKGLDEIAGISPLLSHLSSKELVTTKVLAGGPVADDRPWIMGRNPENYKSTIRNASLALNFDEQAFIDNAAHHVPVCGIGTFGWGPGQLENELASSLWHFYPATRDALERIPFGPDFSGAVDLLIVMKNTELKRKGRVSSLLDRLTTW
ncbi:hypothetical protein EB809_19550 [Marinobacter sp. R17]|uniref:YqgE/AlgH family protein n=1 Tax=Marinobacter sp. R17 TaxID=2484250 RepID=UPI000F4CFE37|nr:YqgE/AlgH family protein [Marinobacter sp. R17]ROT94519.1 hypothetical protein EB809_19550 [Marinobacter sp. R17]